MTASATTLNYPPRALPLPGASSRHEVGKHQFQVVAANIADAVLSIGGLIYDRAMAGWDVSVVVDGDAGRAVDDRPVRILGARVVRRSVPLPRPRLLAVATDMMVKSDAVRRQVLAIDDTEVLLWGRHHPTNLSRTFVAVHHRPSVAAHVFKSQALIAVGAQAIPRVDEGLYSMT